MIGGGGKWAIDMFLVDGGDVRGDGGIGKVLKVDSGGARRRVVGGVVGEGVGLRAQT